MSITVLVISACLVDNPSQCKEINLNFDGAELSPYKCIMGAAPEIAKWNEGNPKWFAKKWRCKRYEQNAHGDVLKDQDI